MHDSLVKLWKGAKVIDCIFRIKPLNVRTTTYDFFVIVGEFVGANTFNSAHAAWSSHNRTHSHSKLIRNEALKVKIAGPPLIMSRLRISNLLAALASALTF